MSKTIECFFDFGSPATYLAATQLPRIASQCGATLRWRPMLLGGVFKATGNASPVSVPAKGRWMLDDLAQWAAHWGVPMNFNPHFPINTLTLMRIATGVQLRQGADFERFSTAMWRAMWVDRCKLDDPGELARVLTESGLDAAALMALATDPQIKAALVATTEEAVSRGVFGAPSMFVDGRLFFGQDRLPFVQAVLAGPG